MNCMDEKARAGLFVCECGDKIAGRLDVPALVERARELPAVAWVGQRGYWCLPAGLDLMRSTIVEQHLDRTVVAGCAARTHDLLFRRALDGVVNPSLIGVTNVRDLCAGPCRDGPEAWMARTHDQIAVAVADIAGRQASAPRVARITPHVVVIGGGVAGMTATLAIGRAGIAVTVVERKPVLGGDANLGRREGGKLAAGKIAALGACENVRILTNTQIEAVGGTVGRYEVKLSGGEVIEAGAIVVATGAKSNAASLDLPEAHADASECRRYAFVLCDMSPSQTMTCSHTCCPATLQRAAEIKRQSPDSQVTIMFREIYTAGGLFDDLVWQAQQLGVNFVRYPAGMSPRLAGGEIVTYDELAGCELRGPFDQVIAAGPMTPQDGAAQLAGMLRLPIDERGFIPQARLRLRPVDCIERGIYVCGAAHYPCDSERALLQAHDAAERAVRHIRRTEIVNWAPSATIDASRCNGCGDCVRACPFAAVRLESARCGYIGAPKNGETGTRRVDGARRSARRGNEEIGIPLAIVDALLCTGCGNCVSVCPVKAAQVPTASDELIEDQVRAALGISLRKRERIEIKEKEEGRPISRAQNGRVLVFACEWSGLAAAELAGARHLPCPACTRIMRINCTGRLQPGIVLKGLEMGAAGVLILGCAPKMCHYEQGNERAAVTMQQADELARLLGLDRRIAVEWIPPDDAERFVRVVENFVEGL